MSDLKHWQVAVEFFVVAVKAESGHWRFLRPPRFGMARRGWSRELPEAEWFTDLAEAEKVARGDEVVIRIAQGSVLQ